MINGILVVGPSARRISGEVLNFGNTRPLVTALPRALRHDLPHVRREEEAETPRRLQASTGLRDAIGMRDIRMSRPMIQYIGRPLSCRAPCPIEEWGDISSNMECRPALTPAVVRGGPRHKVHAHTISSAAATAVTAMKMAVNASLIMPNTVAGPIGRLGTITPVLCGVG
jgi:hypothetical protein